MSGPDTFGFCQISEATSTETSPLAGHYGEVDTRRTLLEAPARTGREKLLDATAGHG